MDKEFLRTLACATKDKGCGCGKKKKNCECEDVCVVDVETSRVPGSPNDWQIIVKYSNGKTKANTYTDHNADSNTYIQKFSISNGILYGIYNTGATVQVMNLGLFATVKDLRKLSDDISCLKGYSFADVDIDIDCDKVGDGDDHCPLPFREGNGVYIINKRGQKVLLFPLDDVTGLTDHVDIFVENGLSGVDSVTARFNYIYIKKGKTLRADRVTIDGIDSPDITKTYTEDTRTVVALWKDGIKIHEETFLVDITKTPDPVVKEVIKEVQVPGPVVDNTKRYVTNISYSVSKGPGRTVVTYKWVTIDTQTGDLIELPININGTLRQPSPYTEVYTSSARFDAVVVHPDNTRASKPIVVDVDPVDSPADVVTYQYEVEHTNPGRIDIPHPWNNVTTCIDYKVWKIKLVNGREESRELTQDYTSNKDKNRFCTLHNDSITLDLVVGVGGTEVRKSIPIVVNRLPEPVRPVERVRVSYTKNHEGLTLGKTEEIVDKGSRVYNTALLPSDEYVFDGWFVGGTRVSTSLGLDYVATESVTIEARMSQKPVVVPDGPKPFKLKAPVGIEHTLSDNDTRIDLANSCYVDGGDGQGFSFTLQLADDSEEYISVLDQNIPGISVSTFDTNKKEILIEMDCRDYRGFVGKILELVDRLGRKILVFLGIGKNRPATPPSDDITIVVRDNPEEGGVSSVEDYVEPSTGGTGGTTTTQADKDRFPSSLRSVGGIWYAPESISAEQGNGWVFQGHYHRDSIQDYTQLVIVTTNKREYSINVNDMVPGLRLAPYQLVDGEFVTQMKFVFRDRTELVIY